MKKLKRGFCLMMIITLLVSVFSACGKTETKDVVTEKENTGEKIVTMAMQSSWTSLYPYNSVAGYDTFVQLLLFDCLFNYNAEGEMEPRLAKSYEINDTFDEYTFYLDENAAWTDGTPVTADDVVWTFKLQTKEKLPTARRSYVAILDGTDDSGVEISEDSAGVEKIDDHTVKFTLKKPVDEVTFINNARMIVILPQHLLKDAPVETLDVNEFFNHPIGCGALMYDQQIAGESIEFTVNKNYHLGECDFDKFVIKVVNQANILAGFMAGELDIAYIPGGLPISDYEKATKQENMQIIVEETPAFCYMTMNMSEDYFADVRVRQAFNYAIDKQAIVDNAMLGLGVPIYTPYTKNNLYYKDDVEFLTYDPEKAKALLEEAGWDFERVLSFSVPTGDQTRQNAGLMVQQYLEAVGVKTEISTSDYSTHMAALIAGEYDLGLMSSAGSIYENPGGIGLCYNPDGAVNFGCISDPTYYDVFTKAIDSLTSEEKREYAYELQEFCNEDQTYVYLYSANAIIPISNRLGNLDYASFNANNYAIWEWTCED
ncbi:ABC transporter substrate-binding protein [Roseburia hominis]